MSKQKKQERIIITPDNIDNVTFQDVKITEKLTAGYEKGVPKSEKSVVTLVFDLTGADMMDVIQRAGSSYKITANQTNGELKKNAYDNKSYQKFLADNNHRFEFHHAQLGGRSAKAELTAPQEVMKLLADGKITEKQAKAMLAIVEPEEAGKKSA